jgi:hypothetical protein
MSNQGVADWQLYISVSLCNGPYFVFEKSSWVNICFVIDRKNTKAIAFEEFILSENIHRGEIGIENPRYALLFIVVLLKNVVHSYTNAIFNYVLDS